MPENVLTVTQLNNRIKAMLNADYFFRNVTVKGEVSNMTDHSSGHLYFTLKDSENATLKCAMFRGQRSGLKFKLKNGDKIEVTGSVDVYPPYGSYQLYASRITLEGQGELFAKYLALKEKLQEEGLFAQEYKREIPTLIKRLGVITAPTGAAVRDMISIAKRRNPFIQIVLFPALVQGEGAPASLIKGLKEMVRHDVDTIIIGRGGGSIEDLWAFNDEALAREIFQCPVPIISAVGHETDFTIADFAADLRAATPSEAAEKAVIDFTTFENTISYYIQSLYNQIQNTVSGERKNLQLLENELKLLGPQSRVYQMQQRLDTCTDQLQQQMMSLIETKRRLVTPLKSGLGHQMDKILHIARGQSAPLKNELIHTVNVRLSTERNRLKVCCERLEGLSPLNRIRDGYGYLSKENGKRVFSVSDIKEQQPIHIYLSDGRIDARVETINKDIFKRKD